MSDEGTPNSFQEISDEGTPNSFHVFVRDHHVIIVEYYGGIGIFKSVVPDPQPIGTSRLERWSK